MQKKELNNILGEITSRLNSLMGNIKNGTPVFESAEKLPDITDQAAHILELSMETQMYDRSCGQIHMLQRALQRLQDGTYGKCVECGEDIPVKRLMAKPETTLCVGCQNAIEKRSRHYCGVAA